MAKNAKHQGFDLKQVEAFIEKKVHALMSAWSKGSAKTVKPAKKLVPIAKQKISGASAPEPVDTLLKALESHPRRAVLVKAGQKQKDQLLRSLIPLYIARKAGKVDVSSGVTSKFWSLHGVKFAAPNAAKVLREHKGFSKRGSQGPAITDAGVKYVENAIK